VHFSLSLSVFFPPPPFLWANTMLPRRSRLGWFAKGPHPQAQSEAQ